MTEKYRGPDRRKPKSFEERIRGIARRIIDEGVPADELEIREGESSHLVAQARVFMRELTEKPRRNEVRRGEIEPVSMADESSTAEKAMEDSFSNFLETRKPVEKAVFQVLVRKGFVVEMTALEILAEVQKIIIGTSLSKIRPVLSSFQYANEYIYNRTGGRTTWGERREFMIFSRTAGLDGTNRKVYWAGINPHEDRRHDR